MQTLKCKHCYAPLPEQALRDSEEIIVCEFCGTVHYRRDLVAEYPSLEEQNRKRQTKQKRSKPDKWVMKQLTDGIQMEYPWFGKQHRGLLFFAVIWNAFIIFFTVMVVGGMMSDGGFDLGILCFMTPFYAVGIGMAYYVLTGIINRTRITIKGQGIATEHGPIPTFGNTNKLVDRRTIEQVYARRRVSYTSNDVPVYVFDVHYIEKGGEDVEFIKGLDSIHKAVFIEQQIEQLYKIDDMGVDGEFGGMYR